MRRLRRSSRSCPGGLREGELERARRQLVNGHVYALESNSDAAGLIGFSHILLGDASIHDRYVEVARTIPASAALSRIESFMQRAQASLYSTGPGGQTA